MWTRKALCGFAAGALALMLFAPVVAATPSERGATLKGGLDSQLPTDGRPIVATVIEIDEAAGTVTLETAHGPVALSVTPDLVERLSVGDVVVVRFTDEDEEQDWPSALPREAPAPENSRI